MAGRLTYGVLLLPWALLVIGIQWGAGHSALRARWRLLLAATVIPTVYLVGADSVAIWQHIWTLHDERIVGVRIGNVPIEEALFFLLTDLMVVQSVILLNAEEMRSALRRTLRRRRPSRTRREVPR